MGVFSDIKIGIFIRFCAKNVDLNLLHTSFQKVIENSAQNRVRPTGRRSLSILVEVVGHDYARLKAGKKLIFKRETCFIRKYRHSRKKLTFKKFTFLTNFLKN